MCWCVDKYSQGIVTLGVPRFPLTNGLIPWVTTRGILGFSSLPTTNLLMGRFFFPSQIKWTGNKVVGREEKKNLVIPKDNQIFWIHFISSWYPIYWYLEMQSEGGSNILRTNGTRGRVSGWNEMNSLMLGTSLDFTDTCGPSTEWKT